MILSYTGAQKKENQFSGLLIFNFVHCRGMHLSACVCLCLCIWGEGKHGGVFFPIKKTQICTNLGYPRKTSQGQQFGPLCNPKIESWCIHFPNRICAIPIGADSFGLISLLRCTFLFDTRDGISVDWREHMCTGPSLGI